MAFKLKFTFPLGTQWKISSALYLEINGYFERSKCFLKVRLKASIKILVITFKFYAKSPLNYIKQK